MRKLSYVLLVYVIKGELRRRILESCDNSGGGG